MIEAVRIGAHALSATGQAQDARVLDRMLILATCGGVLTRVWSGMTDFTGSSQ